MAISLEYDGHEWIITRYASIERSIRRTVLNDDEIEHLEKRIKEIRAELNNR